MMAKIVLYFTATSDLNTLDDCSKSFYTSNSTNHSVEEMYGIGELIPLVNKLFSTVANNTLDLDDGSLNMSLGLDLVTKFLVNPFSQHVSNGGTTTTTIDTMPGYVHRNVVFHIETEDGMVEGAEGAG